MDETEKEVSVEKDISNQIDNLNIGKCVIQEVVERNIIVGEVPKTEMNSDTMNAIKKFTKDMSKAPAPKQLAVGATAGWLAGYMTMKVGKAAATLVGGSLLVLQIAHHKGYVKVNWQQLSDDCATAAEKTKDSFAKKGKNGFEQFQEFAAENVYLAGGFTGGFFLGIAWS